MNNQNYIILKRGYVIFSLLLIALLFLNSCNNIEEYSGGSVIEELNSTSNRSSQLLYNYLEENFVVAEQLKKEIGGNHIFSEEISLRYNTTFGTVFAIPYGSMSTVFGAIYVPVEEKIDKNKGVVTLGNRLKHPVVVNSKTLESKVPFEQRYIFSRYFKDLEKFSINVDYDLKKYTYFEGTPLSVSKEIGDKIIDNTYGKESSLASRIKSSTINSKGFISRANESENGKTELNITIFYDAQYIGYIDPFEVTSVQISQRTLEDMAYRAAYQTNGKIQALMVDFWSRNIYANIVYPNSEIVNNPNLLSGYSFALEFFNAGFLYDWCVAGTYVCTVNNNNNYSIGGVVSGDNNPTDNSSDKYVDFSKIKKYKVTKKDHVAKGLTIPEDGQTQMFSALCAVQGLSVAQNIMAGTNKDYVSSILKYYGINFGYKKEISVTINGITNLDELYDLLSFTWELGDNGNCTFTRKHGTFSE